MAAEKDMLVDVERFSREFLIEKEMDDLVANAGPANSVTFGVVAGCNAAAAASVARSVAVGTSANAQINSAESVAAAPVVKSAADPVANPVADAVAVGPIAADPAIDNKRAHRPRGTAAGIRRQQDRFMRFLYQLSSAHYNWGKRSRPRAWQNQRQH